MAPLPSPTTDATPPATTLRFPEVRKDVLFNRWVIFNPARSRRPSDFKSGSAASSSSSSNPSQATPCCPFCIGREHECAPEIFRVPSGSQKWQLRVIQNLYPALRRELDPPQLDELRWDGNRTCDDAKVTMRGFGVHDVVIETPYHGVHLCHMSVAEVGEVLLAYKERILQLADLGAVEYVQVFKNHGASAGASMSHSHSQMMGLPFVPSTVLMRLECSKDYLAKTGKCFLCEVHSEEVLIDKSQHFFSMIPHAAAFPFEVWIVPQGHAPHFSELDSEKAVDLGGLLNLTLHKLSKQLNDPPFNFMIHTSPLKITASSLPYSHWFLQIVPQLSVIGGFEMGSGCYINPVFPEDAAKVLREVNLGS